MDNRVLILYGLILPITSFLVVLGGGFMEKLGGPAVQWCAVYALVHVPPIIAVLALSSSACGPCMKLSFSLQYITFFWLCA